jgi:hypothetical protein
LNRIYDWGIENEVRLNSSKTIIISKKRTTEDNVFTLKGVCLTNNTTIEIIGITMGT